MLCHHESKTSLLADKCGQTDHFSSKRKESEGGESLFGSNVAVVFTGCSEADASEPCAKLPRLSPNIKGSCGQSERRASLRNRSAISSAIVNRRKSSRLSRNIKEDPCRIMASGNGAAASGFKDDQSIARVHKEYTNVQPKDELKVRSSCEEVMEVPRSVTPDAPLESKSNDVYTPRVRVNRASPLPPLTWADRHLVWKYMCDKERDYKRTAAVLDAHPALQSRMRAILLDWLSEVSEVYKLHRETYYIAVDYIDRYLQATCNVPKQQLQLLVYYFELCQQWN
ncbi:hypothetical protein HAZT_HAZT003263 [Hyalella azteca]|uniref:Cyclin N-terminal domain-containing protein n=1 Tax=Hyalella azteca TaxID=294128 RepID=A0A6A0HCP6_HYAAZ|nr:hypothetical protein HAZT_HAZT003263 [Hyalella azteca]